MFRRIRRGRILGELTDLRTSRERGIEAALSHEHRMLLRALEKAGREPVSISDLEAAGIAHPGSLVYELEVSGVEIEHVYEPGPGGHKRLAGFRLVPPTDNGPSKKDGKPSLLESLGIRRYR